MSKVYTLKAVQKIPVDIDTAWDFFSSPLNLAGITPEGMGFSVIGKFPLGKMYPGQIIEYKVKPLPGMRMYWMTEITHVSDKKFFVDEQRFGPYSLWHHQHHFTPIDGGIEMTDLVHYKIPYWFIGDIANTLFVRKQLEKIFAFRYKAVQDKFGVWPGETVEVFLG